MRRYEHVLYFGDGIVDEGDHELPIALDVESVPEASAPPRSSRVHGHEHRPFDLSAGLVEHIEPDVHVAAALVGDVGAQVPPLLGRQIPHREPRTRRRPRDVGSRTVEQPHELPGSVAIGPDHGDVIAGLERKGVLESALLGAAHAPAVHLVGPLGADHLLSCYRPGGKGARDERESDPSPS